MKTSYWPVIALACAAALPVQAHAASFLFDFSGPVVSGALDFTYEPHADPSDVGPLGSSPNTVDPVGSYVITNVTGTFSDTRIGVSDEAVTGVVKSNPANPTPNNYLAPASFGFYDIDGGLDTPEGHAPGLSYDDLFYPHGSPQTASSYPAAGGFLDIYGVVFTLSDGKAVDLWSNGSFFGSPISYGVAVTDGKSLLDYVPSVPEPASWVMTIGGLGVMGGALRRRRIAVPCA